MFVALIAGAGFGMLGSMIGLGGITAYRFA